MKALVLAAGLGERLRPLTGRVPKPLLEIGGRPLIHYALLMLRRYGVTQVAINLHHLGDQLRGALGDGSALGIAIRYAPEPRLLGTGGPIAGLRDFFAGEQFVVINSDTLLDLDLSRMLEFHRANSALATFALRPIAHPGAYSEILLAGDGRVHGMRLLTDRRSGSFRCYHGSPAVSAALRPFMYCGLCICTPAVFDLACKPPPFSLVGDLFAPALEQGHRLFGYAYTGFFRTVDDLAAYYALQREFAAKAPALSYLA